MQKEPGTCREYELLKTEAMQGWKTWNVHNVFSFVHMPDGLSVNLCFKEYRNGCFLRDPLIGRFPTDDWEDATEVLSPVMHAVDDSYTAIKAVWCDMEFLVESAADEDYLCIRLTPVRMQKKPALIVLHAGYLWNRPGSVRKEGEGFVAAGAGEKDCFVISCSALEVEAEDLNIPLTVPFQEASFEGTVYYMARKASSAAVLSREAVRETAEAFIEKKKKELQQHYDSYGKLGWMVQAMECALSYDTVYDPAHNRIISPVSRLWSIRKGGYVLFCWDNLFAGYLAMESSKALAYSNVIEIINEKTDRGFVPNMSCGNGLKTLDRSQPPVGSRIVLELYRHYGDDWIVKLLYPALFEWNTWFFENRRNPSGALSWGSDPYPVCLGNRWETDGVYDRFGAALESGLDNSPMYDDVPFDRNTHLLMLEDVGLTGLYLMDCAALITLAGLFGHPEDVQELRRRKMTVEMGLEGLWDEENGFYYNRRTDTGEFSRRISPTNFYALFADEIPTERLERILKEHFYNPEEFYGEWLLPSIARNDPAYPDQDYWRGRVWAPMNFVTYLAFEQQGLTEACRDLAEKSIHIFEPEWKEHGHVHENYNAMTGEGCDAENSDKFYHWGALLTAIALREFRKKPSM